MQGYQQRLLFFVALYIATTYAEVKIEFFGVVGANEDRSGIFATHVGLTATVAGCPEAGCKCDVQTNGTDIDHLSLVLKVGPNSVPIANLQSHTTYVFTLTCESPGTQIVDRKSVVTTDYDRPAAPQNINASFDVQKLKITWQPLSTSDIPIDYFKIKINDEVLSEEVKSSETSFQTSKDYAFDTTYKIIVRACRKNNQKQAICSLQGTNGYSINQPAPTTTTTTTTTSTTTVTTATTVTTITTATATTTTTPKSTGVSSYSISLPIIISSLFLFIQMN